MNKPSNETWNKNAEGVLRTDDGVFVAEFADADRAELAAQAPAMARLLLAELENGDGRNATRLRELLRAAGVLP